ncbi:MAG: penicillin-binding protein 2 [candidate division Zixibacteria bacterium]|nr:penicillin-binding protein 2 [candidate division Zixibacteria bacterium]
MTALTTHKDTRVKIAGALVILLLLIIAAGLFYHQVLRHDKYLEESENNRIRISPIIPKRGLIYDRHREVIADNRVSFTVSIVPFERVPDITTDRLAQLLDMDTAMINKRARSNFVSNYIPSPIKRGLGMDVISILEEQQQYYPGVAYSVESVRRYEQGISAEAFIGHVGEVSPEDIKSERRKGYRAGSMVGKEGIEKAYDQSLRGLEGTDYLEISAKGQITGSYAAKEKIPAVPGSDIVLTIDKRLQRYIAESFDSLEYSGAVVAMDPRNGEILGLGSFPGFDPNIFSGVIPPAIWQTIISDTNHPLLNRPIAGLYPPGSTAKLIAAGAALEMGIITEHTTFKPCLGKMRFGDRLFGCWDLGGHGKLDVYGAIEQSCDIYFYQVGQLLGVDSWGEYASACGFGRETGIDIPGELKGIVPGSDYYDKLYGPRGWTHFLVLNLAIGQGEYTITPLQLAQFYCGLANNGVVYRPHLLKEVLRPDGIVEQIDPVVAFTLPFSRHTLEVLHTSLELVVQGEHGTARSLRNKQYTIAGKTGTAQNPHGNEHSWFVAYAPSDNPRIVVVTLVENAGHGSEVAAPITGRIIKEYLGDLRTVETHAGGENTVADES